MSAVFAWAIQSMTVSTTEIDGHSEVVLTASWQCVGTQSAGEGSPEYQDAITGGSNFPIPAGGGSFTPYADLTQEQVLGWCYANGVDQTDIESRIQANITAQMNPPVTNLPLPWATPAA
jgi:hypothetical protein